MTLHHVMTNSKQTEQTVIILIRLEHLSDILSWARYSNCYKNSDRQENLSNMVK
jgi:hypothetical protein